MANAIAGELLILRPSVTKELSDAAKGVCSGFCKEITKAAEGLRIKGLRKGKGRPEPCTQLRGNQGSGGTNMVMVKVRKPVWVK